MPCMRAGPWDWSLGTAPFGWCALESSLRSYSRLWLVLLSMQALPNIMYMCPLDACRSLGLFSGDNPFRLVCLRIITNAYFEGVILLLVLLSSVLLALDNPSLSPQSPLNSVINVTNLVLVICFTFEMCLKVTMHPCLSCCAPLVKVPMMPSGCC